MAVRAAHRLALAVVIVFAAGGAAPAFAPERSPVPPARPATIAMPGAVTAEPSGTLRRPAPVPRPAIVQLPESMIPDRPPVAALPLAGSAGEHPFAPVRSLMPPRRSSAALARHADALRRAARADGPAQAARTAAGLCGVPTLEGRRLPRIVSQVQGCGIAEPVSVTAAGGVRLSPAATLDCDTARAFDRWVRESVQPALGRRGGGVVQIRVAAHYTCRPRNNRSGARISEHGRGRAIDVAGFRLADGETVSVLDDWQRGPHSRALRQMHQAACGIFRTTLGPGSDGMHEDHFHYDLARRQGGGTFCR